MPGSSATCGRARSKGEWSAGLPSRSTPMRDGTRAMADTTMESQATESPAVSVRSGQWARVLLVALAAATGLGLMVDSLRRSSPTYDEVLYLQVAARWWRTGDQ